MPKTEVEKLLGSRIFSAAEEQARNMATNPNIALDVGKRLATGIQSGEIDPNGESAKVIRAALDGKWFQQRENNGVCMDDVTPEDR